MSPPVLDHLVDRTALVTGASRNLGAVLAHHLAAAGARVVVTGRTLAGATAVRDALEARWPREHVALALASGGAVATDAALADLHAAVGRVDVLVNNAGPFGATPFTAVTDDEWSEVLDANLSVPVRLVRALAPGMSQAGWGRVINLAAGSAFVRDHATYGLVKHAVVAWTEALALELGPAVTVNAVAPGQIAESVPEAEAVEPGFAARCVARTPLGRLVTRDEVAALVVTMLGPVFDAVTGVTVPIDGGWRLPRA